jgi:hypothetical protein
MAACVTRADAPANDRQVIAAHDKWNSLAALGQRWPGMERVMGIENTAGAHQPFEIMTLRARRALRAIIV